MDEIQRLHASVVKFLIDGGQADEAAALLACHLSVKQRIENVYGKEKTYTDVTIEGSRKFYDEFYKNGRNNQSAFERTLAAAFEAFFDNLGTLQARATLIELDTPHWKEILERILTGDVPSNQGLAVQQSPYRQFWQGLHFRSSAVLALAKAFDKRSVSYLTGCPMRIGVTEMRQNIEPDFLVCQGGKWGILQVADAAFGEKYARLLKFHGIKLVEVVEADFCSAYPDQAVHNFLTLLENS